MRSFLIGLVSACIGATTTYAVSEYVEARSTPKCNRGSCPCGYPDMPCTCPSVDTDPTACKCAKAPK